MRWSDMVSAANAQVRRLIRLIFQAGGAGSNPVGSTTFPLVRAVSVAYHRPNKPVAQRSCHLRAIAETAEAQALPRRRGSTVVSAVALGRLVELADQVDGCHATLLSRAGMEGVAPVVRVM